MILGVTRLLYWKLFGFDSVYLFYSLPNSICRPLILLQVNRLQLVMLLQGLTRTWFHDPCCDLIYLWHVKVLHNRRIHPFQGTCPDSRNSWSSRILFHKEKLKNHILQWYLCILRCWSSMASCLSLKLGTPLLCKLSTWILGLAWLLWLAESLVDRMILTLARLQTLNKCVGEYCCFSIFRWLVLKEIVLFFFLIICWE